MGDNDKVRDAWSKLEVISKLIGDVLLVALTIVIGYGSNQIATAL